MSRSMIYHEIYALSLLLALFSCVIARFAWKAKPPSSGAADCFCFLVVGCITISAYLITPIFVFGKGELILRHAQMRNLLTQQVALPTRVILICCESPSQNDGDVLPVNPLPAQSVNAVVSGTSLPHDDCRSYSRSTCQGAESIILYQTRRSSPSIPCGHRGRCKRSLLHPSQFRKSAPRHRRRLYQGVYGSFADFH